MNLIGRIRSDAELRKKIDATFARPLRDTSKKKRIDPPPFLRKETAYRSGRVGIAFDHLLRLAVRHRNLNAAVFERPLIIKKFLDNGQFSLDWSYSEKTKEKIATDLRKCYLWEENQFGLDCMPLHSMLASKKGYRLRNSQDIEPGQGLRMSRFFLSDKWLSERLSENFSFEDIVEELFYSLGQHRQRVSEYREAVAGAYYLGERFVSTGEMSIGLAKYLLKLSNLEMLWRTMRSNFLPPDADAIFVESIPQEEIDDLLALYRIIPSGLFQDENIWLNPDFSILNRDTYPAPRKLLRGGIKAEGDLIIDDFLIDVKTTKTRMTSLLPLGDFCQLMDYFSLISLEGKHHIRRLGIYYARYGYLFEFPIPKARPGTGGRSAFLEWFRKRMGIEKRRVPNHKAMFSSPR